METQDQLCYPYLGLFRSQLAYLSTVSQSNLWRP